MASCVITYLVVLYVVNTGSIICYASVVSLRCVFISVPDFGTESLGHWDLESDSDSVR